MSKDHTYAKMVSSPTAAEPEEPFEIPPETEEVWPALANLRGSAVSPVARREMSLPPVTGNAKPLRRCKMGVIKREEFSLGLVATGSNCTVGLAVVDTG